MPSLFRLLSHLLRRETAASGLTAEVVRRATGEPVSRLELYERAMQHRSLVRERPGAAIESNERLEFLGDAVLGLIVAEVLYARFPDEDEGYLTRLRAKVVNGRALARRAQEIGLGNLVLLSEHAAQDRGRANQNILADAYEALIGAVYLDRGIEAARRFVRRTALEAVDLDSLARHDDNHKSLLLEFAQARGWPQPVYRVVAETGPDHDRVFTVEAVIGEHTLGSGSASSKKRAEQVAAFEALAAVRSHGSVSPRIGGESASKV